jgi:hypothetical protein
LFGTESASGSRALGSISPASLHVTRQFQAARAAASGLTFEPR